MARFPAGGVIQSDDPLEREADQVANQMLADPIHSPVFAAPPRIQRSATRHSGTQDRVPQSVDRALSGPGRPLDHAVRQDMERRFHYDFSQVRVHSDTDAAQSAGDIQAHAYTAGSDIVFGAGRFAPGTQDGRRLLAHELTHVVQQSGGGKPLIARQSTDDADSKVSLGYLDNAIVGEAAQQVLGEKQWIVLREFLRGLKAGLDSVPPEQQKRIDEKFNSFGLLDATKYAGGYALGIIEGIWASIKGLIEAVITLFELPYDISSFLAEKAPELAAKYGPRIAELLAENGGLSARMNQVLADFLKDPVKSLNQINAFLDAVGGLALAQVRALGRGAAGKVLELTEEPWFDYGRDVGKVVGQVLFEVILAIASDAIANVVKEAVAVAGRLATRLIEGAAALIRSAGRLVGEALEWITRLSSKAAGKFGEMLESVRAFLLKMKALFAELCEEGALAVTGTGVRMPIPDSKPPVLESRAIRPPGGATRNPKDLIPPKIHPSNLPKDLPAPKASVGGGGKGLPKREPFANDPEFHKGFEADSNVPGARDEPPGGTVDDHPTVPDDRPPGDVFNRTQLENEEAAGHRERGNTFNTEREPVYPHNEVAIESPSGRGRVFLDSYDPGREIVSRKYPIGQKLDPQRAIEYITELGEKYPPGARIADTPKNRAAGLAGQVLRGQPILEVPVLQGGVPQEVLDFARRVGVVIRDTSGRVY